MSVLANAENPGFIADNFVGAAVNVVTSSQSGATLNPTTGQVLGASTELPATGADAMWLGIAAVLFATGIGLVTYDHRKRRLHA